MFLYANGCSMTMGAELPDPAEFAYPAVLASQLGFGLFNDAQGGSSNCRILRTSMMWISEYLQGGGRPEELFVLIGWTGPDRREIAFSAEEHSDQNLFWRSLHIHHALEGAPVDFVQLRKLIIRSFWCDRESMTRFLVAVNSLQGFLASRAIRFCFSHALPVCELHPELVPLVRSVNKDSFFHFMDSSTDFLTFCTREGVPAGALHHPLEEGHRKWAGHLADFIGSNRLL